MTHTQNLNPIIVSQDQIFVQKLQKNYGFIVT